MFSQVSVNQFTGGGKDWTSISPPPRSSTAPSLSQLLASGRYAFYWDAFLFSRICVFVLCIARYEFLKKKCYALAVWELREVMWYVVHSWLVLVSHMIQSTGVPRTVVYLWQDHGPIPERGGMPGTLQFLSFSCSFREKILPNNRFLPQIHELRPPPPSRREILYPPQRRYIFCWNELKRMARNWEKFGP